MRPPVHNAGSSLVEAVVALGIFALLAGSIAEVFLVSLHSKDVVFEQLFIQAQGRAVMQNFINELRSANVSSIGGYPLVKTDPNEIIFYSNIDSDAYRERVRYALEGNALVKGVIKPSGSPLAYAPANEATSTVAANVLNGADPLFYYYGQDYTGSEAPLANPRVTDVRVVQIKFQLEKKPDLSPAALNLQAQAEIRSLKNN